MHFAMLALLYPNRMCSSFYSDNTMTLTKELLRTGFYNIWRPRDGYFKNTNGVLWEEQYKQYDHVSTIMHLDEALEYFQHRKLEGKEFSDFSLLENLKLKITIFCCSGLDDDKVIYSENNTRASQTSFYESLRGNIKLEVDIEYIFRLQSDIPPNIYFVEVIDMNKYSVVRILVTTKNYETFPKVDFNMKGAPVYRSKNRLLFLKYHENYEGKLVNYVTEILTEDISDLFSYWDVSVISPINHEGHKRFRCKRVLDRISSICVLSSKEDCLAGILAWILLNDQFDIFSKFPDSVKRRLTAVNQMIQSKYPPCTVSNYSEDESEMSISDIESECENNYIEMNINKNANTHTELNTVCDVIVHSFYSSDSTMDIIPLQYMLEKCDMNVSHPTNHEIKACLVLMLKWLKDPIFLHKDANRRGILLSMIPCEKFLTLKYQSLSPCDDITCMHENYLKCPDTERICYGYLLFSVKRWQNEDMDTELVLNQTR